MQFVFSLFAKENNGDLQASNLLYLLGGLVIALIPYS